MITIIGGGPGGYTAAIRAAQLGAEVTLVEKEEIGGACLNWGCVPSKVFLRGSEIYRNLKQGESYGLSIKESPFDMQRLVEKKDEVKQTLVVGLKNVLRSYGVRIVHGEGKITDETTVKVGTEEIPSEKIIIATGSKPDTPHLFQELVVDYKNAFDLRYIPRSVMIVYGGVFSVELAWFFLEMGSQVYMLTGRLLEKEFEDIEGRITSLLKNHGLKSLEGRITHIKKSDVQKFVEVGDEDIMVDEVIWMKRKVVTDGLPEHILKNGFIPVNDSMQTAVNNIYAVGDATGSYLAGDAMAQGITAAEHCLGKNSVYKSRLIPKVLYAPEAAVVGLTEKEAESQGHEVIKGSFPFGASGRAQTISAVQGRVTMLSDKKYGEILGAYILGKGATELIHVISFAMTMEATVDEFSSLLCAHPTMTEMVKDAGLDMYGNAFNMPRK
jgi:dihydrolipoamide dehydrogenase